MEKLLRINPYFWNDPKKEGQPATLVPTQDFGSTTNPNFF